MLLQCVWSHVTAETKLVTLFLKDETESRCHSFGPYRVIPSKMPLVWTLSGYCVEDATRSDLIGLFRPICHSFAHYRIIPSKMPLVRTLSGYSVQH